MKSEANTGYALEKKQEWEWIKTKEDLKAIDAGKNQVIFSVQRWDKASNQWTTFKTTP